MTYDLTAFSPPLEAPPARRVVECSNPECRAPTTAAMNDRSGRHYCSDRCRHISRWPRRRAFTVLLLFPDYFSPYYGEDFCNEWVCAADGYRAIDIARRVTARRFDIDVPEDFGLLVVLEGHHRPLLSALDE